MNDIFSEFNCNCSSVLLISGLLYCNFRGSGGHLGVPDDGVVPLELPVGALHEEGAQEALPDVGEQAAGAPLLALVVLMFGWPL